MAKTGVGEVLLYAGIGGVVALLLVMYLLTPLFKGINGLTILTIVAVVLNALVIAGAELIYRRR